MTHSRVLLLILAACLAACSDSSSNRDRQPPPQPAPELSAARVVDGEADRLLGPLARGSDGDIVLENEQLRVIIQQPGRNWFGLGTYGGNIIDAGAKLGEGSFTPDHLEEFVTGINIENTANYTNVEIRNDGSDGEPAVVCASGPDDLIEVVNASSAIRALGAPFPDSADDRDLPVQIETCYSLAASDHWVTMDTTVRNEASDPLPIYWVEYLNGSGEVEAFQPFAGFGEPQLTAACPADQWVACAVGDCDPCNYLAYTGTGGATGVSYGMIHEEAGSSSFSSDGVNTLVLGQAVFNLILGGEDPVYEVPGSGELTLRRYFAVGDGSASSIGDIRNQLLAYDTGNLAGQVTSGDEPLSLADVAVYKVLDDTVEPPVLFMAGHSRTDAEGRYAMSLPPGDYQVQAHKEGYLYANEEPLIVTIAQDLERSADFDLPAPGFLQVDVTEVVIGGPDQSSPAKLQVVGIDPSPPLRNRVFTSTTGVFGDDADRLPHGVTAVQFVDRSGSSELLPLEPGDYQVVVSRGPRYSAFRRNVTIESGNTTEIQAEIVQVVATPGLVSADFHVHSIDSIDSELTRAERVATYLAEGVDFFTPSDHGMRTDFSATIEELGASDLIGTAPSAEISPFDYGHFNSWPVTLDPSRISAGSVDWGGEASPGMDFPAYGSYALPPAEIMAQSLADPLDNIVQINHIGSHFGAGGLAIDTGMTPPQSHTDLATRRLDPALGNAFSDNFHALEVWIGTNGADGSQGRFVGENMGDWFNLINQGMVRTAVANSDSHDRRITFLSTRNLIASAETDPGQLSGQAEQLAANVAEGRVVGSNAPLLWPTVTATYSAQKKTAALGIDNPLTIESNSGNTVRLRVDIATPNWAPVDTVDVYVNNQPQLTSGPNVAARYGVCANYRIQAGDDDWSEETVTVLERLDASRTEIGVDLELTDVTEDSWIVVVAYGSDGVSEPMFPVVPEDLDVDSNQSLEELTDGNLGEGGHLAFAFSNPLFIDVGRNGWTPPGVNNAPCEAP